MTETYTFSEVSVVARLFMPQNDTSHDAGGHHPYIILLIRLYPNPATDRVVIESPEGLYVAHVSTHIVSIATKWFSSPLGNPYQ